MGSGILAQANLTGLAVKGLEDEARGIMAKLRYNHDAQSVLTTNDDVNLPHNVLHETDPSLDKNPLLCFRLATDAGKATHLQLHLLLLNPLFWDTCLSRHSKLGKFIRQWMAFLLSVTSNLSLLCQQSTVHQIALLPSSIVFSNQGWSLGALSSWTIL